MKQVQKFFQDKNVIVQAKGAQRAIYKVGSYLQSARNAGLVTQTLELTKLAGISGFRILQAKHALAVAIPTTGVMLFYGCRAITGNNAVEKVFVTTNDVLVLPMKGVEIMWSSYGNLVIQKVFEIPVILNMTQIFKTGPGYIIKEISYYISLNNTFLFKCTKNKIIKWLS